MAEKDFNNLNVSPDVSNEVGASPEESLNENKDTKESLEVILTKDGLKNKETKSDDKMTRSQNADHTENTPIQKPAESSVGVLEKSRETTLGDKGGTEKPGFKVPEGGAKGVTGDRTKDVKLKEPSREEKEVIGKQLENNGQKTIQSESVITKESSISKPVDKVEEMKKIDATKPDYAGGTRAGEVTKENHVASEE